MASYNLLTNVTLKLIREPSLHLDGRGLYVRIDQSRPFLGADLQVPWTPPRDGAGSLVDVDLNETRHRADDARRLLRDGIDPIETRREERAAVERPPSLALPSTPAQTSN